MTYNREMRTRFDKMLENERNDYYVISHDDFVAVLHEIDRLSAPRTSTFKDKAVDASVDDLDSRLDFVENYLGEHMPNFNAAKRRDELNRGVPRE